VMLHRQSVNCRWAAKGRAGCIMSRFFEGRNYGSSAQNSIKQLTVLAFYAV
jgi:hypothetical protein